MAKSLMIIVGVALLYACSNDTSDSKASEATVGPSSEGAVWLDAMTQELDARQQIMRSFQRVEQIINNENPYRDGFNLADVGEQLGWQQRALQNEGLNISNQAARIANFAAAVSAGNRRNELALTNEAKSIENFGKRLQNVKTHLDNELKALEVSLRQVYLSMYHSYARAFNRHSQFIFKLYSQMQQTSNAAARSLTHLKQYNRQANLCASRARNVWRRSRNEANQELREGNVSIQNIPRILSSLSSQPNGEQCLHKTLLTMYPGMNRELFNIHYVIHESERTVQLRCPTLEADASAVDAELGSFEFDLMDYPMPVLDEETYQPIGYFQPLTYYQLYKLITDNDIDVKISHAPANDRPICNRFHPGTRFYLTTSMHTEKMFSEFDAFAELDIAAMPTPDGRYNRINHNVRHNQSYMTFIDRMTTIFRKTDACIEQASTLEHAVEPSPVGSFSPDSAPLEARATAKTILTNFFDPSLPKMSETIRSCMQLAEHHRYQAFNNLEVVEDVFELINKMSQIKAPQSPHPVMLAPAEFGGNR